MAERRILEQKNKQGFDISSLILLAVLLAAGAVLKMTVGSFINFFGMKPNFIIAMYCLAILLIRPKIWQSAVIGIIAGAICQVLPGTPWLNFGSEFIGAAVMGLLILVPMRIGSANLNPFVATFLATLFSGGTFVVLQFLLLGAAASALVAYIPIVLFTALLNSIIVGLLFIPLSKVLGQTKQNA
jgi:hypothetical protein